jgi:hypothetical protein
LHLKVQKQYGDPKSSDSGQPFPSAVFSEGDHALLLCIPEVGLHRFQTLPEADGIRMLLKHRRIAMCLAQVVVRDGGAEMMNVVVTYIASEPMQHARQAVISTAFDSREHIVPVVFAVLIDILILMLYVEKPQRISAKEKEVDELHQEEFFEAEEVTQCEVHYHESDIAESDTLPHFLKTILAQEGKTIVKHHIHETAHREKIEWAAVDTVPHLAPGAEGIILLRGEAFYIAYIAVFQLAIVCVMEVVRFGPVFIRNDRESTGHGADNIIGGLAAGERAVATVMLDDEYPAQQEAVESGDQYAEKHGMIVQIELQRPKAYIDAIAIEQLDERLAGTGALILLELLIPVFEVCEHLLRIE